MQTYQTLHAQQLIACAYWNHIESERAKNAKGGDKAERDYLARRAIRLAIQSEALYQQADEYEWDATISDPSNYACDGLS